METRPTAFKPILLTALALAVLQVMLLPAPGRGVEETPVTAIKHLAVSDLSLSSAAISWVTDGRSAVNWVEVKQAGSDSILRFEDDYKTPHYVHRVQLIDLTPATDYLYRLGSADQSWDNGGQWYGFRTFSSSSIVVMLPIVAQVVDTRGDSLQRVLVRVRIRRAGDEPSLPVSLLTDAGGRWTVSLANFFYANGSPYDPFTGDRLLVECFPNYWSAAADTLQALGDVSRTQSFGKLAVQVTDPNQISPGDVDGNSLINIFDLLELLRVLGGSKPPTGASDVDVNGVTNIFDLLALLRKLGGTA